MNEFGVNKHMIRSILLFCLFVWGGLLYAQISHGGSPMMADRSVEAVQLELSLQPETMQARQIISEEGGKLPVRFAEPIFTDFTPANSGVWDTAADGTNVWRLAISSPGARSLNLIFDRFKLRKGDQLFVYNKDRSHVLGAFTESNNKESGLFAIAPVRGDEIIVELQPWGSVEGDHQLLISAVNHDYLGVFDEISQTKSKLKSAGTSNIDVACSEVASKLVDRAVCKIILDGTELCSGTLLNNTSEDGIPYFLTAGHCIKNPGNTDQNVVFYFNYESPICDFKVTGTTMQTLSGAQLKSYVGNMDYALLQMNTSPPASY
ncbi:MAG: lysyl endopeptidase, partial [Carboxylicivirga sp.]|nr:lysyl endopeptidase [Carboxylicivirga sp.]